MGMHNDRVRQRNSGVADTGHPSSRSKRRRWWTLLLVALTTAMPAIAQRASEFSDPTDERVLLPHGQLAIGLLTFFAVLWAIGAKNGPLHAWAEEHSSLAIVLLIGLPLTISILFG